MPRRRANQPYTKFRNQGNKKLSTPIGKFNLSKYYYVNMPTAGATAPMDSAVLRITASTPFQPLSVVSGTWTANDSNNEVHGINTSPWIGYNHLVVLGCKVKAVIKDSVDNTATGSESLHEGIVRLTRTTDTGVVVAGSTNSNFIDRDWETDLQQILELI